MIAIVDYGMGNLASVAKAFESLYADVIVTRDPADLSAAERIVLPGVGAFGEGMGKLHELDLVEPLTEQVLVRHKPFLGICLGMELMATDSHEAGYHRGLGWIDGTVRPLADLAPSLKAIHIGWNDVEPSEGSPLFAHLGDSPNFYFVHQYYVDCRDPALVSGTTEYGGSFAAAVQKGNLLAVQFHPEKSQEAGLALLRNFLAWDPSEVPPPPC